ncbi:MAG TPA: LLM class flavin-dependent oxidoreductase [Polyangiaceae bacterium]|nr:LLM class flavin-dependent oxidoreductase [Polyangiaceae bacterium]
MFPSNVPVPALDLPSLSPKSMPPTLPLSVLDLVPLSSGSTSAAALKGALELACTVDRLGFRRLWYAEHHNMPGIATTTPEIMIAHVGQVTTRVRLGAGGVMLPNHSSLKVAESYRLLEALHPGRIDLGIGRAPGTDPLTAVALRRSRSAPLADDFLTQLAELSGFGDGTLPPGHPFAKVRAMPDDVSLPPIWLLGSSDYSANLAAELGLGFAFAGHFSPDSAERSMRLYRERFQQGALAAPHAILALSVFCAEEEAAATRMASSMLLAFAQLRAGRAGRMPSPDEALAYRYSAEEEAGIAQFRRLLITGTPAVVRRGIERMAELTLADEVMIATHAHDPAERMRSYALIAREFGLSESEDATKRGSAALD